MSDYPKNLDELQVRIDEARRQDKINAHELSLNAYQEQASKTAVFQDEAQAKLGVLGPLAYTILGMNDESGEVAGAFKKFIRGGKYENLEALYKDLIDETSDVLWYVAAMCDQLGITLEDLARRNLTKLDKRKETGTIRNRIGEDPVNPSADLAKES